jgi:iron-sulfur cluster repair protein YtfE (RIC family)
MNVLTAAVVAEHLAFGRHIEDLRRLADDCGDERILALVDDLDRALGFLEHELLPHAAAEDALLYPAVAAAIGAPSATATMSRDHVEIARLVHELRRHRDELLSPVAPAATHEVQRLLYALHAVLSLHVAKEEEIYLPLLERALDPDAAAALLAEMHASVAAPTPR